LVALMAAQNVIVEIQMLIRTHSGKLQNHVQTSTCKQFGVS
jgi:hypothetical protein